MFLQGLLVRGILPIKIGIIMTINMYSYNYSYDVLLLLVQGRKVDSSTFTVLYLLGLYTLVHRAERKDTVSTGSI